MSNVTPPVPPQGTGTVAASPGTQENPSQQQQQAGAKQDGGQAQQQAAPQPTSPAVSLAASLVGIREGMRFKGLMMGKDANGLPVIRTPNGVFVLNPAFEIPPNGEIEIEIRSTGNQIRALLLAIAGKPQHPPKEIGLTLTGVGPDGKAVSPSSTGLAGASTPRGVPMANLAIGSQITASIVSIAGGASTGAFGASPPVVGGTWVLKVVDITTPGGTPGQPAPTEGPGSGAAKAGDGLAQELKAQLGASGQDRLGAQRIASVAGNVAKTPAPNVSGTGSTPGTPTPATATQAAPGTATQGAPATSGAPVAGGPAPSQGTPTASTAELTQSVTIPRFEGVVGDGSVEGRLHVRGAFGEIALATRSLLPPGTKLVFEPIAMRSPESSQPPTAGGLGAALAADGTISAQTGAAVRALATEWPALKEAMGIIQAANPVLAQTIAANLIPSANTALANSILVFLAAMRGGDVRGWLGDEAIRLLEIGANREILNRLTEDMAMMSRASDPDGPTDWRGIPFPFIDGGELHQLWAFVREHRRAADKEGQKALRFVVELDLTSLGGMQLDGLVQKQQFDLIVRSRRALSLEMRHDISELFESSLGATGFQGSIIFNADANYPVSPFRDAQQGAAGHGEIVA